MLRLRNAIFVLLPICILATDIFALLHIKERLSFPYLVVEAEKNVRLTILQHGTKSFTACEAARNSYANALTLGCKSCQISESKCITSLTAEQDALLSAAPISNYSAAIPSGVVEFVAADRDIAADVCRESSESRNGTTTNVICFRPGTPRPPLADVTSADQTAIRAFPAIWLGISVVLLALWPYIYRHGRSGTLISGLIELSRIQKQLFIGLVDLFIVELTLWLAFVLRFETIYIPESDLAWLFVTSPIIGIVIFVGFRLYQSVIRYLSLQAMIQIAKAVAVYLILISGITYFFYSSSILRSVIPIHGVLLLLSLGTVRGLARIWLTESRHASRGGNPRKNVAIYGAGSAGIQLANALSHSAELRPIVFLDDDARLRRKRLGELEVYSPNELEALVSRLNVTEVLLAIPSASRQRRSEIIEFLEKYPVQVRTLPALSDLVEGKIKTDDLREVDVDDLLGRDAVNPDPQLLKQSITGKSVLVTGAGGSIGAELCRQIVTLRPKQLVLFEQSEFALYQIEMELAQKIASLHKSDYQIPIIPIIGSVTDQNRIERTIESFSIETIYHAAAYKHVPMVEHNPCEGVINNVLGTYRAASAARKKNVSTFVLISTDKAVRPTNTMGATKRVSELILQAFASAEPAGKKSTSFSAVRFGNVLGSSGSVVPLFREQIRRGGPVTVTDPRIIRYFMTISEAAQLVLQAGAMGHEGGEVFVLDMGEPVKILDLAHRMIRLSGLQVRNAENPQGDIEIIFTGLRPGEKLYEELLIGDEPSLTSHPRIMRAREKMIPLPIIEAYIAELEKVAIAGSSDAVRSLLIEIAEDFQPQCGNEDYLIGARV